MWNVSRTRLALGTTSLSLVLAAIACGHSDSLPAAVSISGQPVEVHAHRGGAWVRPENSLVAFHVAIAEIGSDVVELDLRPTKDNQIAINHDPTLNPAICLDPKGHHITDPPLIANLTLHEVQKYDCGSLVGLKKGTPLAALNDVFDTTAQLQTPKGKLADYDLHIKWDSTAISAADFAALIMKSVKAHNLLARVTFMNETSDMLSAIRALEPTATLMYLTGGTLADSDFELMQSLGVDKVAPIGDTLDEATAKRVQDLGIKLIPWIVDEPAEWEAMFALKVDGIITDDPLHLRERIDGVSISLSAQQNFN